MRKKFLIVVRKKSLIVLHLILALAMMMSLLMSMAMPGADSGPPLLWALIGLVSLLGAVAAGRTFTVVWPWRTRRTRWTFNNLKLYATTAMLFAWLRRSYTRGDPRIRSHASASTSGAAAF